MWLGGGSVRGGSTLPSQQTEPASPSIGRPALRARPSPARIGGVGAVLAAVALVAALLLGSSGSRTYELLFQTGGQLVEGNEVLVGGEPIGSVEEIALTPDNRARVTISVDDPLHEGTTAVIRATSLSGIANRYVSISPGPDNAPELADGATLAGDSTTTPVDLDQLFNALDPRAREGLRGIIRGSATAYGGRGPQANATYRYFAPALTSTDRLLRELVRDERVFTDFLVDSARVFAAVAERGSDLSALTANANRALGAVASQNRAFDRSLEVLPSTLRRASTTFVNLRAAIDDLEPLVETSKPATRDLAPFLADLQPVLSRAVPVFADLDTAVLGPGDFDDLGDLVRSLPELQGRANRALNRAILALDASQPVVEFARPYSPDLLGAITKLGQATAYYDASGHYARVQSGDLGLFRFAAGALDPIPPSAQFSGLQFEISRRCPGAATQPAPDGSSPFLDGGNLTPADCNPADLPPGP
jgi:phospholipid/cholesterol/gamma-HCH transport system substrate-binding protein